MKAKGPAGAKPEEKPKGNTLFQPRPPTPKMLKAFGKFQKGAFLDKVKVKFFLPLCPERQTVSTGWQLWINPVLSFY